jgi:dGTP triphosphohydrolase
VTCEPTETPGFSLALKRIGERVKASFGDEIDLEGNAQTLRIIARLEKKQTESYPHADTNPILFSNDRDCRLGLNLTYRSMAAILKYDHEAPQVTAALFSQASTISERLCHNGFFRTDLLQRW